MYLDNKIKDKISNKSLDIDTLRDMAIQNGMITLGESCKNYVLDGTTSFDEYIKIMLGNE